MKKLFAIIILSIIMVLSLSLYACDKGSDSFGGTSSLKTINVSGSTTQNEASGLTTSNSSFGEELSNSSSIVSSGEIGSASSTEDLSVSGSSSSYDSTSNSVNNSSSESLSNSSSANNTSSSNASNNGSSGSQEQSYTINIDYSGAENIIGLPTRVTIKDLVELNFSVLPSKTGYNFRGWEYNGVIVIDQFGKITNSITLTNDMTFKAIFVDTAKLTLVSNMENAGELNGAKEYSYYSYCDISATVNENYIFVGWYEGEQLISTEQNYTYFILDQDVILEARYTTNSYNLTISTNNAEVGMVLDRQSSNKTPQTSSTIGHLYLSSVTIVAVPNENSQVAFLGWYNQKGELVHTETIYTFIMGNSDCVLEAKWNLFNVTYDLGGGEQNLNNPTTYSIDDTKTLFTPTKENYVFAGWTYNGDIITQINGEIAKHITLVATWNPEEYTIGYNLDCGSVDGVNPTSYDIETESFTLINPTKVGYEFAGWSGTGIEGINDSVTIAKGSYGNREYTANWTPINYTITYNLNEGIVDGTNVINYNIETESFTLINPTKVGYEFAGWSGTGIEGINDSVTIAKGSYGNREYTANWTPINYTITYNLNEGIVDGTNVINYNIETESFTLINPTKVGYEFAGWSGTGIEGINDSVTIVKGSFGNREYTANWKDPAIFIFSDNSITGLTEYGKALSAIEIPNEIDGIDITTIGAFAFYGYKGTSITIPNSVTSIETYAFSGCCNLSSITIPDSVISIGSYVFDGCNSLQYNIKDNLKYLGNETNFYLYLAGTVSTSIITATVDTNCKFIEKEAFKNCSRLESIILPFVGGSKTATEASSSTLFGYIFGSSSYNGSIAVQQYFKTYGSITFYIPSSLKQVTVIGGKILYGAFYNCSSLNNVTIDKSITSIGSYAFYNCSGLSCITFEEGSNLTTIDAYAFVGCTAEIIWGNPIITTIGQNVFYEYKGTSITIPSSVTSIGISAFYNCSSLSSITLPFVGASLNGTINTHFGYIFGASDYTTNNSQVPTSLKTVIITGVTSIGNYAFYNCTSLSSITIPESVTSIGNYAFYNCTSLSSITIPESVTSIGDYAFINCTGITEINYNATNCSDLRSGNYVFAYVGQSSSEAKVTIGANVTKIPAYLFYPYSKESYLPKITSVEFKEGSQLTSIGNYAFYNCTSLSSITIPESVTSIGNYAFGECRNLTSITIPESVTSIGSYAFINCTGITEINYNATNCSDLRSGNYVFAYVGQSSSETKVTIGANVTKIPAYLFYPYSKESYLPKITSVEFKEGSQLTSIGNYAFGECRNLTSITMPNSVKSVGDYAFNLCTNLTSITIGNSATSIGDYVFNNCYSLTSVTIGDSVKSVGDYAFNNCNSLLDVYYCGDINNWASISFVHTSSNPFFKADNLYLKENGEWKLASNIEIIVPSTVTNISAYAFYNCYWLTKLTIPESVTNFGEKAFYKCASLIEINYNATNCSDLSSGDYVFNYAGQSSSETKVTIGANVTKIPAYLFYSGSITSIEFKSGSQLTTIGSSAFGNCNNLVDVYYDGDINNWVNISFGNSQANPFFKADNLYLKENGEWQKATNVEIEVPNTATSINSYVFSISGGWLTKITISNSVTSIGSYAFSGCTAEIIWENPTITTIGEYAFADYKGKSITIPSSVTSIGQYAFSGCSSLSSITLPFVGAHLNGTTYTHFGYVFGASAYTSNSKYVPTSLRTVIITGGTSIEKNAFYSCSTLTKISIPNSVYSIGFSAFQNCTNLNSVSLPFIGELLNGTLNTHFGYIFGANSYIDNSKYVPATLKTVAITGRTTIEDYSFYVCDNITSVTIGDSVTSIGDYVFNNCFSLTNVTIGDSVKSVGDYAFNNCNSLLDVYYCGDINNWASISFMGNNANPFVYADNLYLGEINAKTITEVELNNTITKIGSRAFYNWSWLTKITISSSVTSIGDEAFGYCSGLIDVYYDGDINNWIDISFGNMLANPSVYADNLYLKENGKWQKAPCEIVLSNTVTSIGNNVFYGWAWLTKITISSSVTSIGEYVFRGCTAEIIWDNPTITTLGEYAFADYKGKSIIIPSSVTSIGEYAFSGCTAEIIWDNPTITTLGEYAFANYKGKSIIIPNSVTSIGYGAFSECGSLQYNIKDSLKYLGNQTNPYMCLIGVISTDITTVTIDTNCKNIMHNAFDNCGSLMSLIIPNGVTSIGSNAFYNCSSLTSITIPNSVPSIGSNAFYNCSSLTIIELPNSVTSIGNHAFYNCSSLTDVYYDGNINNWVKISFVTDSSNPFCYAKNLYLKNNKEEWQQTTNLEITIPNTLTHIRYQFVGCSWLAKITIPNSVTNIGQYAFSNCNNLSSIVFEEGSQLKSIETHAFENCSSLTSITIPNSVTSIASYVFSGCYKLKKVVLGNNVLNLSATAFANTSLQYNIKDYSCYIGNQTNPYMYLVKGANISAPIIDANCKYICSGAFENCSNVTSITIPNSVISIGDGAFYNIFSLTSVTIGNGVTTIGDSAFAGTQLTSITIPNSVKSIGGHAFYRIANATGLTIGDGVTSIGNGAFKGCASLGMVDIPSSVTSIGDDAFEGCRNLSIVTFEEGSQLTSIGNGAFKGCASLGMVDIPSSVTSIGGHAFEGCSNLSIVTFEEGSQLTSIGGNAFYNCSSLTIIELPNSVTSIGSDVFFGCISLNSISVPFVGESLNGTGNTHFGYFFGASTYSSNSSFVPDTLTVVTITGETSIASCAFYNCTSLSSVTISSSVTSIGRLAFYGCDNLTSVTFEDTSTWYIAGETEGTPIGVTSPTENAVYFKNDYYNCYWYKI